MAPTSTDCIFHNGDKDEFKDKIFAWLEPVNESARVSYMEIANLVVQEPQDYRHAGEFMQIHTKRPDQESADSEDDESSFEEMQTRNDSLGYSQMAGRYLFSMNALSKEKTEWSIGAAYGEDWTTKTDIILCPASKGKKFIKAHHAFLLFHRGSSQFIISAHHTLRWGSEILRNDEERGLEHGDSIIIGECEYVFYYTPFAASEAFDTSLRAHMGSAFSNEAARHHRLVPPSATTKSMTRRGDYTWSEVPFSKGAYGSVFAGRDKRGNTIVVKQFTQPEQFDYRTHIELMREIGHHENIMQLVECFATASLDDPKKTVKLQIVYTPLANGSAASIINRNHVDAVAAMHLMRGYARGLARIHSLQMLHRDISPGNVVVHLSRPPRGMIIDTDRVTKETPSWDYNCMTRAYMAPEVIDLKMNKIGRSGAPGFPPYDAAADVWSLAVTMIVIVTGNLQDWPKYGASSSHPMAGAAQGDKINYVTKARHEAFCRDLNRLRTENKTEGMSRLIEICLAMLQFIPGHRVSCQDVVDSLDEYLVEGIGPGKIESKAKRAIEQHPEEPAKKLKTRQPSASYSEAT
ncbi:MAG: hypothetical protein Q9174_002971 [Haloplaca sp. 1 TL-2023]